MNARGWIIAIAAVALIIAMVAFARGPEVHDGVRGGTAEVPQYARAVA